MLTKISVPAMPKIRKTINGKDASSQGAFAACEIINFTVDVPRQLGASAVVLRICEDGQKDTDYPLTFKGTKEGVDTYSLNLDTGELCGDAGQGLFFYEILFLRGLDTLFTSTTNQVDFTLERYSDRRFALLVYEKEYKNPEWFKGRIMYHIFVDRFYKGDGDVSKREDVIINEDWNNGTPQYAKKNGEKLANNMFFGGNLWGVAEKLDYLKSIGVGIIYLSPIFKAYSNHKYDTGDYMQVDGMFGGDEAFKNLIKKAKKKDIRIILDGVFNHTGDNSIYFDRYGEYGKVGAYSNPDSEYRNWYNFKKYPNRYEAWWGIEILPRLNHNTDSCREYFVGKGGVCEKYVLDGIGGWRLDVADELPDRFLDELRSTVHKASDGECIIIGEVWENAALKIAYSDRRRYFRGRQLDSVMNYPLRNGILGYIEEKDASFLANILKEIYATYPRGVCHCLMNLLGTHDTERILTVLGEGSDKEFCEDNDVFAKKRLTEKQYARGVALLKIASAIQYTVYGVPSVFYGDEVGLEGYHDPFCRRPFPWGRENTELLEHYKTLGKIRTEHPVFIDGEFEIEMAEGEILVYSRRGRDEHIKVLVNLGNTDYPYELDCEAVDLLSGKAYKGTVKKESAMIVLCKETEE
ncbi:MAG: glycoside hydrolase family 13 protein [Ruminococcaceae bacterium]|nr:glycoside hydrolase family 13 protein [Oscillospiraceae bacterium]